MQGRVQHYLQILDRRRRPVILAIRWWRLCPVKDKRNTPLFQRSPTGGMRLRRRLGAAKMEGTAETPHPAPMGRAEAATSNVAHVIRLGWVFVSLSVFLHDASVCLDPSLVDLHK
jgi:hypothetical protein